MRAPPLSRLFSLDFSLGAAVLLCATSSHSAAAISRGELLETALRSCDTLAREQPLARTWEDAPYLSGTLLLAEDLERREPGSGAALVSRVRGVVAGGSGPIANGDYAAWAQAALDLYRLTGEPSDRRALLVATDPLLDFAERALGGTGMPPADPWWVPGGLGTRFWVDDLFSVAPWLAMRGASREAFPSDARARDLAYEWVEAYLHDHRLPGNPWVPAARERAGPLLWDDGPDLFRHDAGAGWTTYWGRGNGWAGFGLVRVARYLDRPYSGARYAAVEGRPELRALLARLAASLAARRSEDGGWGTDLLDPERCGAGESSATGLVAFFLARGVNEGWLDRAAYVPVALKALRLLLGRLDAEGHLAGIQPPGTGPACAATSSADRTVDVAYGVGALLLAAAEIARFPDPDLARLEEEGTRPVAPVLGHTWLLALSGPGESGHVVLRNSGDVAVHAEVSGLGGPTAGGPILADVAPGAAVKLRVSPGSPSVAVVRATRALDVREGATTGRRRGGLPRNPAVPLATAISDGEVTLLPFGEGGATSLGCVNPGPFEAEASLEILGTGGLPVETISLVIPPAGALFVNREVAPGAMVRFTALRGSFVPLSPPRGADSFRPAEE